MTGSRDSVPWRLVAVVESFSVIMLPSAPHPGPEKVAVLDVYI